MNETSRILHHILYSSYKPAFLFIANLAVCDLLIFLVEVVVVHLQVITHPRHDNVTYHVDLLGKDKCVQFCGVYGCEIACLYAEKPEEKINAEISFPH